MGLVPRPSRDKLRTIHWPKVTVHTAAFPSVSLGPKLLGRGANVPDKEGLACPLLCSVPTSGSQMLRLPSMIRKRKNSQAQRA